MSLAITALYVLLTAYAADVARVVGPVYAVVILALFFYARPWRHHRRGG